MTLLHGSRGYPYPVTLLSFVAWLAGLSLASIRLGRRVDTGSSTGQGEKCALRNHPSKHDLLRVYPVAATIDPVGCAYSGSIDGNPAVGKQRRAGGEARCIRCEVEGRFRDLLRQRHTLQSVKALNKC